MQLVVNHKFESFFRSLVPKKYPPSNNILTTLSFLFFFHFFLFFSLLPIIKLLSKLHSTNLHLNLFSLSSVPQFVNEPFDLHLVKMKVKERERKKKDLNESAIYYFFHFEVEKKTCWRFSKSKDSHPFIFLLSFFLSLCFFSTVQNMCDSQPSSCLLQS